MRLDRIAILLTLSAVVACSGAPETVSQSPSNPSATSDVPAEAPSAKPVASTGPTTPLPPPSSTAGTSSNETACAAGNPAACNNLGSDLAEGRNGVAKDLVKAKAFYQKSCDLKDAIGCFNLGNAYRNGEGVAVDTKQAATYYTQSCDQNEPRGCTELAIMYYEGKDLPKDEAKAITLFEKSCKLGSDVGCKNLATLRKGPH
jgi:TPR repeat protein